MAAVARAPLPPLARTVTPLEWAVVLAVWLGLALLSAGPLQQKLAQQGVTLSLHDLRIAQAIDWAVWAALLRLAFLTLDRLPLRRGTWLRHLPVWLGAA